MIKLQPKDKRALLKCALGLVNVLTGEIYPADVYIYDGFIAHVETEVVGKDLKAGTVINGNGNYLIPGFIDAHVHIESSMLTPRNFAKGVINHGTTTVVTDPHEISNVFGVEAVEYMHNSSEGLPMRQLIDIPSCVPAVPGLENSGAAFFAKEITQLSKLERVIGLAEVMDFVAVQNGEDRMMDIIEAAENAGLYIQGHAPFMSGRALSAYTIGGPKTCHESRNASEFLEKLRIGMFVDARESSIAKDIKQGVKGTKNCKFLDNFCICTDDREADDILNHGQLNLVVRKAIEYGMDEVTAIKSATYNTAREIKIDNLGAIAPGYVADMQIVSSLKKLEPSLVMFEGNVVSKNGKLTHEIEDKEFELEKRNSVNIKDLTIDKLIFKAPIQNGKIKVNVMTYADLELSITNAVVEELNVVDGKLDISNDKNLKFCAVINRYGRGNIGYGVIRNFGTTKGAVASTVSHDCHNLIVVYDTPENAILAANALIECGGGMSAAFDNKLQGVLELKIGGLMSNKDASYVSEDCKIMKKLLCEIGLTAMDNPLLRIVTLALPVIPNCKMSDLGIVDVMRKEIIPLYLA
ncbi:MAG: adenine deaminase C-terminal domain-containing protein [Clostridia bacterium]